ncbi:cysteine-rich receptor-like protein kinase, partial [Tanacetum coccineum]
EELNNKLLAWDEKAEDGAINEHDILKREEWIMDLLQIDRLCNKDMKQKCRFRWVVEAPRDIKQVAMDHYAARFKESFGNRPMLESNLFRKLSTMEASLLESDFSIAEVKDTTWDCPSSKAPGPMVILKLLASRLARVIDSVICPNQSTFIKGRQILDGCLVANEIIRMAKLEDPNLLIFKVDFEKNFDSVNWNFLLDVTRKMGFGLKCGSPHASPRLLIMFL